MRFKQLNERVPPVKPNEVKSWETWDNSEKEEYISELLRRYNVDNSELLRDALRSSVVKFGADPVKNPFIEYFAVFSDIVPLNERSSELLKVLVSLTSQGYVDKSYIPRYEKDASDYLLNASLFNRTPKEFSYTVKVFEMCQDKTKLKSFFKDISDVNIRELYVNDSPQSGVIKPAGSPEYPNDLDTIFGTVEKWADNGNNDVQGPVKKKKNTKVVLTDRKKSQIRSNSSTSFETLDDLRKHRGHEGEIVFVWRDRHEPPYKDLNYYMMLNDGTWEVIDTW